MTTEKSQFKYLKDGTKLVWSDKYNDYVLENLDQLKEDYKEVAKKNIEICYSCDKWDANLRMCTVCNCFMDVKKIVFKLIGKNPCPLKKW